MRWTIRAIAGSILAVLAFIGWNLATGNFATVRGGRVYRSGQIEARSLTRAIRTRGIKTVLNLRGSHPEQAWYRAEHDATLAEGATQIDLALSSCEWMSRAQMQALVHVLDTSEYPLLIHCWRGSERTGLVSAFTELLRAGGDLADAEDQFSLRFLFVRAGDGKVMREHLDQYEDWLRSRGLPHSPDRFRAWVAEGFQPGRPSREQWPYDPYPLVVVSKPGPRAGGLAGGGPEHRR